MANGATRLFLHLAFQPNPVFDEQSGTDDGPAGGTANPNVDVAFGKTWSITCSNPDPPARNDVGEITIALNSDNTVKSVSMWVQPNNETDASIWWGFNVNGGFSNDGDPSFLYVTGLTWVAGPHGPPSEPPPVVSEIGGMPKADAVKGGASY